MQMLMNLTSNRLKFTPAGGAVTVGAQNKGSVLLVGVTDTGIGMNQEEALIALQPFRKVDGSPSQQVEGSGLGLPLVKSYIELHGGGFRLESGPGKGTLVSLRSRRNERLHTTLRNLSPNAPGFAFPTLGNI